MYIFKVFGLPGEVAKHAVSELAKPDFNTYTNPFTCTSLIHSPNAHFLLQHSCLEMERERERGRGRGWEQEWEQHMQRQEVPKFGRAFPTNLK
ncbi:hypothetical protein AMTR_s00016p00243330 [Amborella trichopoda]|uniref:Uncharacterized protein n=1 Tax=Amborella trichopoda TaxID=13333 RepID=W1PGX5_AMBTC|nr:hypothetical protein AMTR_s00016p00243330 [Amborella trichopoda]